MKALIILSHSRLPFFLLTYSYLYGENELLQGPVRLYGVFSREKLPQLQEKLFLMKYFYNICLSNIIKYGECDVEQQISTQHQDLSAFWNYSLNRMKL